MNYLGLNCSVEGGFGRLTVIIIQNDEAISHIFRSPSVFSFGKDVAEILNWHKDNIISLLTQYNIDAVVVKKTERTAFYSKPKDSDIFKLYLEGVMLSLAGGIGKPNKHFYKRDIQTILKGSSSLFDKEIKLICSDYELTNGIGPFLKAEKEVLKDTLLATVALKNSF